MTPSDFCKLVVSSKSPVLFYDIETRGADEGTLRELFKDEKVELPKHPGEFDPYRVKYGNIKDEAKKREKLQQVMEAHEQEVRNWEADCAKTQEEAWAKYVDQAALS